MSLLSEGLIPEQRFFWRGRYWSVHCCPAPPVFFSTVSHRRVCVFPHSCIFTDSRFASRPTIRQFSTLIAYGLHRGAAEQRSVELLLAQHVTQSSVKLPSRSGGLGQLKWAELGSKAGTKPNVPILHILILLRSMHCFFKEESFHTEAGALQEEKPKNRFFLDGGFTNVEYKPGLLLLLQKNSNIHQLSQSSTSCCFQHKF